ncbi:MAG: YggS family pyridoxal phosphate-dependent enzyme [Gemmataceae bacterium]
MPSSRDVLRDRLRSVQDRIGAACARAGRHPSDVVLVAVTKKVPTSLAALLPELGLLDLGENRPQELWRKAAELPKTIRWHLIGHLQRNKVEPTLPLVNLIHSIDSQRLLDAIDQEATKQGRMAEVLLEVNVADEESKHGLSRDALLALAEPLARLSHVRVCGLMTMAPLQEAEKCRPVFAALRELRDRFQDRVGAGHELTELSMGMSNDFEVAVEEGATMVRLGTVLWEGMDAV